MSTKTEIIEAIQAAADATENDGIRSALGEPGEVVTIEGLKRRTGAAWEDTPTSLEIQYEGLANWLDSQGIGGSLKSKINELISGYTQLKSDYNNGVVPTTAPDISPLP